MATEAAPARPAGPTRLVYFDDMSALRSAATVIAVHQEEGGRVAVVLDATVFHPQGGGQPADTGAISAASARFSTTEDLRVLEKDAGINLKRGLCLLLIVSKFKALLLIMLSLSRLHSAGHLLDICVHNVGLFQLEPGKGYHFPDGPFVEYKGAIPPDQIQDRKNELEREAKRLISEGAKVLVTVVPYEEAEKLCGGSLPSYILKDSTPRIVKFGEYPGGPCGGTHVTDISIINNLKVIIIF
ncbi:hypothetical protein BAE44_0001898 [Dichanthelium oligosanthes]|uniref:Alanyl-tRNA editing protein AlaX-L n=1 Tax=Dichanthelium oligosanthes TaxID=888268 RepID=A0A1E5WI85_9POAL|nr:hypothetical protein BAE44_0001898 [Dichanthelium oligosanthes]